MPAVPCPSCNVLVHKHNIRLMQQFGNCRMTGKDMVVGGYRVPKDTPVQLPPYSMHLSSDNYVRPLDFWPERWTQQAALSPIDEGRAWHPQSITRKCDTLGTILGVCQV